MSVFTVERFVRDFLREHKLTDQEIDAVIKIAKDDPSLHYVGWEFRVVDVPPTVIGDLRSVIAGKVIYWAERYRPQHPALKDNT